MPLMLPLDDPVLLPPVDPVLVPPAVLPVPVVPAPVVPAPVDVPPVVPAPVDVPPIDDSLLLPDRSSVPRTSTRWLAYLRRSLSLLPVRAYELPSFDIEELLPVDEPLVPLVPDVPLVLVPPAVEPLVLDPVDP